MAMGKSKPVPARGKSAPVPAVRKAAQVPQAADDYSRFAGKGFEAADKSAYALPRLNLLQQLSPQVQKQNAKYVPGAEPGMFFNPVTNELFTELYVVNGYYKRTFIEWRRREDSGGGFIAEHAMIDQSWAREDKGPWVTDDDHVVEDTRSFFLLFGETKEELFDSPKQAVISMSKSQVRTAMNWMTVLANKMGKKANGDQFVLPHYASLFILRSKLNQKDNNTWYGFEIEDTGGRIPVTSNLFQQADSLHTMVAESRVTAAAPAAEAESVDAGNM